MSKQCFTVVVDHAETEYKGHYLKLSQDIFCSFERIKRKSALLTYNAALLRWCDNKKSNFVFLDFVQNQNDQAIVDRAIKVMENELNRGTNSVHLFILRASKVSDYELERLKTFLYDRSNDSVEILTNVSGIISKSKESVQERAILDRFSKLGVKVGYLAWDPRVKDTCEIENVRFLPEPKENLQERLTTKELIIGFYGKLSPQRGLFELLGSTFFNPHLKYRIVGYGFNPKYIYRAKKFISMRATPWTGLWSLGINYLVGLALKLKRVNFEEKYFEDEEEMALEIQKCSVVFFSCEHSPYSSGIVYQSLAAGVPVLWVDGNSAMSFILQRNFPQGQIEGRDLRRWKELTSLVESIKSEKVQAVYGFQDFDLVLNGCGCSPT